MNPTQGGEMVLLWRDDMSVGQADIDGDHRQLVALVNEFEAIARRLPEDRALHVALAGLRDAAAYHFSREEAILEACLCPDRDVHRQEHRALLDEIDAMIRRYFVERSERISKASLGGAAEFLRRWLIDHVIRRDLRISEHLDKLPAGFRLPD
ncbi:bacteriohemerythrin [Magnetospirillum sp. SS-4]|uniref:bacteriohemerythrin n=1 Tax=Magnetospirillum sp. SS-4 TaxID=2681465 RepID=UPI0015746832|nr:hemerythrin family protein [Magnetospirillum sp. SS-4]